MKRSGTAKFPNSIQLFKFCQKVLMSQRGNKIHDQEVGSILNFNPSDCSHWKRGEKNVRSVFSLAKLSEALGVEATLIHDVASGAVGLDEAYYEWQESKNFRTLIEKAKDAGADKLQAVRERTESFVARLQKQVDFSTPPLYVPEVLRAFAFISTQPAEMMDKLSRVLRVKSGQYAIQFKRGDLRAQTRMNMVRDLARIIFEAERSRFPELGAADVATAGYEQLIFTAALLCPKGMLIDELAKLDSRRNVVNELATLFWVPKSLVGFQIQEIMRGDQRYTASTSVSAPSRSTVEAVAS